LILSDGDLNGLRSDNGLSGIPMKDLRRIYFFGDFEVGIWLMDICDETYLLEFCLSTEMESIIPHNYFKCAHYLALYLHLSFYPHINPILSYILRALEHKLKSYVRHEHHHPLITIC